MSYQGLLVKLTFHLTFIFCSIWSFIWFTLTPYWMSSNVYVVIPPPHPLYVWQFRFRSKCRSPSIYRTASIMKSFSIAALLDNVDSIYFRHHLTWTILLSTLFGSETWQTDKMNHKTYLLVAGLEDYKLVFNMYGSWSRSLWLEEREKQQLESKVVSLYSSLSCLESMQI